MLNRLNDIGCHLVRNVNQQLESDSNYGSYSNVRDDDGFQTQQRSEVREGLETESELGTTKNQKL